VCEIILPVQQPFQPAASAAEDSWKPPGPGGRGPRSHSHRPTLPCSIQEIALWMRANE
jgi:hypothetical protein